MNSVTETYAYDEADKLETVTVNSNVVKEFTYDAAGRTTAIETSAGTTSFAYDYEGRVTSITYPSTSSDTFGYNGLGARASTSGTNGSRTFLRSGLDVTSPVLEDGNADYTPGVSRRASSSTTFAHAGLKNTSAQSAENGTVAASRVYDAFGNVVSSSGSWSGPFGYAGSFGYQEDASDLKLLGHRYYDSSTGRFLSQDRAKDGRNWHAYVDNSPTIAYDSTGLVRTDLAAGAALTAEELTFWQAVAARIPPWLKWLANWGARNPTAVSQMAGSAGAASRVGNFTVRSGMLPQLSRLPAESPQHYGTRLHGLLRGAEQGMIKVNRALPSGKRPDIIDKVNRVIIEVKADSSRSLSEARRQLERYLAEAEAKFGGKWIGEIWTYEMPPFVKWSSPLLMGGSNQIQF